MIDSLRIGIDFDNTIVNYDDVFLQAAHYLELPIGVATGKSAIRAAVRRLADGEERWQRLQARVYGPGIASAVPFDGFETFLVDCLSRHIPVWIISHKTQFAAADRDGVDLRSAARTWLERQGVRAGNPPVREVFFEGTRAEKIARIDRLACTHFIDDLDEIFTDPVFPVRTKALLFGAQVHPSRTTRGVADWDAVRRAFFDDR